MFDGQIVLFLLCSDCASRDGMWRSRSGIHILVREGGRDARAASLLAGGKAYALKWADTEAAAELRQQLPLAKTFTELHGNEKYYKLPQHLTAADEDVREIHKGDVMLFDGQYVVVFYQDFQTTYRYTRLGHVEAANDLDAALGAGDVFLTLQP